MSLKLLCYQYWNVTETKFYSNWNFILNIGSSDGSGDSDNSDESGDSVDSDNSDDSESKTKTSKKLNVIKNKISLKMKCH